MIFMFTVYIIQISGVYRSVQYSFIYFTWM